MRHGEKQCIASVPQFTLSDVAITNIDRGIQYPIGNDALLTAALAIHGVEARHLAYVRLLNGAVPFPDAAEAPLTPAEVAALASPLVEGSVPVPAARAAATPSAG